MTWTINGKQYVCWNFGDASYCCVIAGLSWYYTAGGTNYNETGGTAQIVSRLASGLIDSLTMTNPGRGTFTQVQLNTANGSAVTLQDAQEITFHDEPTDQWCFIPCSAHAATAECTQYGCYWWNNTCHDTAPSCEMLNNQTDCATYGCYWYRGTCHSTDQPKLCFWIDAQGGPTNLTITKVFIIIDSYVFNIPPIGYTFIPTLQQVFGVIDYYLGFDGDTSTGCNYY